MNDEIGRKIKVLAKVCGWIVLIGGFVAFFIAGHDGGFDEFLPWILLACGLVGYVSSWPLYGFGELIESVQTIVYYSKENAKNTAPTKSDKEAEILGSGGWKCVCGRVNYHYVTSCACGKTRRDGDVKNQK